VSWGVRGWRRSRPPAPKARAERSEARSQPLSPAGASAINLAQIFAWTILAATVLPRGGHFRFDEAYLYDRALEVAHSWHLAAYGTPASGGGLPLPGGGAIDLMALPYFFASGPLAGAIWVVLLSAVGAWLFDRALARLGSEPFLRVAATTLFVWSFWHARFADRLWNPHLFLFATPLLLWLSACLATAMERKGLLALAWGLATALIVQIHPSGLVAVALCALLLRGAQLPRRTFALAAVGLLAGYAPYLWAEWPQHFANARQWLMPSGGHADWTALRLGLESFAIFPSHSAATFPGHFPRRAPWDDAQAASFWLALLLVPFGYLVRGRWRRPCLAGLVLVPLSIWASGRGFTHHYVVGAYPFLMLPAAAGLAFWADRGDRLATLAGAYLLAFALFGAALMVRNYAPGGDDTIPQQLELTSDLLSVGHRIRPDPNSVLSHEPLVFEILARRVYGQQLTLEASDGIPCALVDQPLTVRDTQRFQVGRHYLLCWPHGLGNILSIPGR
jgi:hypothetical protein